jgi:hypothetical protein
MIELKPLETPKGVKRLSNLEILQGKAITAIDRIKIMSPDEYEDFILEWVDGYLKNEYHDVLQLGGAGDKGRDVIGYVDEGKTICDYYQCKHYQNQLSPASIYVELGKVLYYTYTGLIPVPRKHYFIAPKGEGPKLHDLLLKPEDLRKSLIKNWKEKCQTTISSPGNILLEGDFLDYINKFDFSIFGSQQPLKIIEQHMETVWHAGRFGGGLKKTRDKIPTADEQIKESELGYISQLFEVYSEKESAEIKTKSELAGKEELEDHFNESRNSFYSAESLMQFSRDNLPNGVDVFDELKSEVHTTIKSIVRMNHDSGYTRLLNCTQAAINNQYSSNPLHAEIKAQDKEGTCHHLANENKVRWVR